MIRQLLSTLLLLIIQTGMTFSQNYPVSLIPDSLIKNTNLVVREFFRVVDMKSGNSGAEQVKRVLTVLNKKGEENAYLAVSYDKNSTVTIRQINLYDGKGEKIKSVKMSEVNDSPAISSFELHSDDRFKHYSPQQAVYPYTIEYIYEKSLDNIISLGSWRPYYSYNTSVQYGKMIITYPEDVRINIKELGLTGKTNRQNKGMITQEWEVRNLKGIEPEPFSTVLTERSPGVYLMPSILEYDKYKGVADNWQQFGNWIYNLYKGRDELSETDKIKVSELLTDTPDTLTKIRKLYKYLQNNTRYVAVSLGIGGYQPASAIDVSTKGYGECKALSNYLHSLLKYAGIKSYPALVASGDYKVPIFSDFPNFMQFDHVILCVPIKKDTIWLECTNQKMPFGFLGSFTNDRDVLLLTEEGGKFAHTTRYSPEENKRVGASVLKIDASGGATGSFRTVFSGLQYDNHSEIFESDYEAQKKWLYSSSSMPGVQIQNFNIDVSGERIPIAVIKENSVTKNFCTFSGKFMILPLNIINVQDPVQKMLKARYSEIVINNGLEECDTMTYVIPDNYRYESIPPGTTIDSNFGSYKSEVTGHENMIFFIRRFSVKQGRYRSDEYDRLYEFLLAVSKADNTKVLLTKTN